MRAAAYLIDILIVWPCLAFFEILRPMENGSVLVWALPAIVIASVVVGWAAESAQLFISQGLALAILAWLQTAPEFAVEAVIAWQQKQDLMIANLTGSLRLLVGFGWPLIFFTLAVTKRHLKPIVFPWFNGLEILILTLGTGYFFLIWLKGSLTVGDATFLFAIYALYLVELARLPKGFKEEEEDLPWVSTKIAKLKTGLSKFVAITLLFVIGAILLKVSVGPFLHGLEALALTMGISSFYFIQWCAPFVSEFPEKVTAVQWARKPKKAPMAVINMVSSNIVQWTVMAAMIPIIFSISKGEVAPIFFTERQRQEILLTVLQSVLSILFLVDLKLTFIDALGLLVLWVLQFFFPSYRDLAVSVYGLAIILESISLARSGKLFYAFKEYRRNKKLASSR